MSLVIIGYFVIENAFYSIQHDYLIMSLLDTIGLSFDRLLTFKRIVEANGITAAAGNDPNRQSQYSRQLKQLEEFFGQELARRGHGKFKLTDAGAELYRIGNLHIQALQDFKNSGHSANTALSLGAGESILKWLVLPHLSKLCERFPKIAWSFENRTSEDASHRVVTGQLDIAIVNEPTDFHSLASISLGEFEIAMLAPKKLRYKNTKEFVQQVSAFPLVVLDESSTFRKLADEAGRFKIKLTIAARCTSYGQVYEGLKSIGGAGFLPRIASIEGWTEKLQISPLPNAWSTRKMNLVWNKSAANLRPGIQAIAANLADRFSVPLQKCQK